MDLNFEKYQGCGNDFIIIDNLKKEIKPDKALISTLCDRHFGIGADGLILVDKPDNYRMNYYNSDGNRAQICGNGLRCLARYLSDHGRIEEETDILSDAGACRVKIKDKDIEIDMPQAKLLGEGSFAYKGETLRYGIVDIGNPHLILYGPKLEAFSVEFLGPLFETDPIFTEGINVNFVEKVDDRHVRVKTWERGDGLTMACGSGASAVVYCLNSWGFVKEETSVTVPGGELNIKITPEGLKMAGPALRVYKGDIKI